MRRCIKLLQAEGCEVILALTHLSLHQDGQNRVPPETKNKGKETKKTNGPRLHWNFCCFILLRESWTWASSPHHPLPKSWDLLVGGMLDVEVFISANGQQRPSASPLAGQGVGPSLSCSHCHPGWPRSRPLLPGASRRPHCQVRAECGAWAAEKYITQGSCAACP